MPFTPFHVGPGLLFKGLMPTQFSLTAFVGTQVIIDLESLYHLLRHESPVHRTLHTLPVATAVGLGAGLLTHLLLRPWASNPIVANRPALVSESTLWPVLVGGLLGGASHPILDGLMHSDIHPFLPLTAQNPLLDLVSGMTLHLGCLLVGGLGLALLSSRSNLWSPTA